MRAAYAEAKINRLFRFVLCHRPTSLLATHTHFFRRFRPLYSTIPVGTFENLMISGMTKAEGIIKSRVPIHKQMMDDDDDLRCMK